MTEDHITWQADFSATHGSLDVEWTLTTEQALPQDEGMRHWQECTDSSTRVRIYQHLTRLGTWVPAKAGYTVPYKTEYTVPCITGYTVPCKTGYTVPGKIGYTIPGKAGYMVPGRADKVPDKAGYRVQGWVTRNLARLSTSKAG